MNRFHLLAGAALLSLGTVAVAQSTATDASNPAGAPMSPTADTVNQPSSMDPAASAPPTTDASMGTSTPTSAGMAPPPATAPMSDASMTPAGAPMAAPSADMQAQWAKYDKGAKGYLTALEFGSWVMASGGNDMTAAVEKTKTGKMVNLPAVKVLNATSPQFAKADTNHDFRITPDELSAFLAGGPAA